MSHDALLTALKDARRRKDEADHDIRVLLAYARELTAPRPYRLADLADAAGISVSGVRTAYTSETPTPRGYSRSTPARRDPIGSTSPPLSAP